MVATFKITGTIANEDNTQALVTLNYFKDNYSTKILFVQVDGTSKDVNFMIEETAYNDMVTSITSLLANFTEPRMFNWRINFDETPLVG